MNGLKNPLVLHPSIGEENESSTFSVLVPVETESCNFIINKLHFTIPNLKLKKVYVESQVEYVSTIPNQKLKIFITLKIDITNIHKS